MRIYTEQEPIPAAVITLATHEGSNQHILFQTRYNVEGFYTPDGSELATTRAEAEKDCPIKLEWAIKALTVSLFRDWSQSGARVTLTCNLPEASASLPRLPRVDTYRGGQYPYLTIDDEIRIYAGYVSSAFEDITGDMLDEVPIDIFEPNYLDEDGIELDPKNPFIQTKDIPQPRHKTGKLVPIFWGFIDKIDYDGQGKGTGHQIILSCRDRTRVLTDTTIINIPSLNGVFGQQGSVAMPQGRLSQIASDVARSVNGYQINIAECDQKNLNCWKTILTHPESNTKKVDKCGEDDEEDLTEAASLLCEYYSAYGLRNASRVSSGDKKVTRDPSLFVRRASFKIMDFLARPRFHMWLSRPPLAKNNGTSQWQILDKSPMTILKWIASKEERSMDFFASHVNGDFCLVPRVLDTSGFYDEKRMYRTYFFRNWPKALSANPPCRAQLILSIRAHTSIVGSFNRFTVVDNSNTAGSGLAVLEGVKLTIDRVPFLLDGKKENNTERKPSPPCRQKIIYDGSLGTYSNSFGGALIVAQSMSAQLARDISGVEMVVLGDPTFYPGEAIRVFNTFLHDEGYQTQSGVYKDVLTKESAIDEFNERWQSKNPSSAGLNGDGQGTKAALTNQEDSLKVQSVQEIGTNTTDIYSGTKPKLPVYKVRSIEHRLVTTGRNAGYTTVVSAALDLNN